MQAVFRRLQVFLAIFLVITAVGTAGFMKLEDLSFLEAFYYNIVTMSTVGYGDIHPFTPAGRVLAIFLIVMGGATFLGVIANATEMLLIRRETQNRMRKVNMVLGVFFSEVGYRLLHLFAGYDKGIEEARAHLLVGANWSNEEFAAARRALKGIPLRVDGELVDQQGLSEFLAGKRGLLVGLLENPVLIEHEGFSEALLAVFHLTDELGCREGIDYLPGSDLEHLVGDMNRAYKRLVEQWIVYLGHLRTQYPYLYSLAVRKNPFDPKATPVVS